MRVSVPASLSKRLDKLATAARIDRIRVPGGVIHFEDEETILAALAKVPQPKRGGYLLVPPILSIDEWEALAVDSQMQLVMDTGEWLGPAVTDTTRDPATIANDRYKPDPARVQR